MSQIYYEISVRSMNMNDRQTFHTFRKISSGHISATRYPIHFIHVRPLYNHTSAISRPLGLGIGLAVGLGIGIVPSYDAIAVG